MIKRILKTGCAAGVCIGAGSLLGSMTLLYFLSALVRRGYTITIKEDEHEKACIYIRGANT